MYTQHECVFEGFFNAHCVCKFFARACRFSAHCVCTVLTSEHVHTVCSMATADLIIARVLALDRISPILPFVPSLEEQIQMVNRLQIAELFGGLPRWQIERFLNAIVRTCGNSVAEIVYEELAHAHKQATEDNCVGMFCVDKVVCAFTAPPVDGGFVQNGSTGFVTWEAAKCLAWFLCKHASVSSERYIELGCGTGITGIMVSKFLQPSQYTYTDIHESTLEQARVNCLLNNCLLNAEFDVLDICKDNGGNADSRIVAADILYDEDLCVGLVDYLSNTTFHDAYIMSTIRTEKTYALFKELLNSSSVLQYEVVYSRYMSEWVAEAHTSSSEWGNFLDSKTPQFDPLVELVRIVRY